VTRAVVGTCAGCGLGVSVPYTASLKPGARVVVMSEEELQDILRARGPDAVEQKETKGTKS
jgi:hypothetical protein